MNILNINEDNEIWKNIPKQYNLSMYIVSSHGKIKNIKLNKLLSLKPNKASGYIRLSLTTDTKNKVNMFLHRLIAYTFLDIKKGFDFIDHINNIKNDNNIKNLRWVNIKENASNKIDGYKTTSWKQPIYQVSNNIIIKEWSSTIEAVRELKMPSIFHYLDKNVVYNGFIWKKKLTEIIDGELWKEISLNNKKISLSNYGRVKTISGKITYGTLRNKYYVTTICKKPYYVHRLIYSAFNDIALEKIECIHHIDENKTNNRLENLDNTTLKKNTQKSMCKKINQYTNKGEFIKTFNSLTEASLELNIKCSNLSISLRNNNLCKGYKFKLA